MKSHDKARRKEKQGGGETKTINEGNSVSSTLCQRQRLREKYLHVHYAIYYGLLGVTVLLKAQVSLSGAFSSEFSFWPP